MQYIYNISINYILRGETVISFFDVMQDVFVSTFGR